MSTNYASPYRAKRGAAKFRRRYDAARTYIYKLQRANLLVSEQPIWLVAIFSQRGDLLTYV